MPGGEEPPEPGLHPHLVTAQPESLVALAAAGWLCWVKSEAAPWNQGSARVVEVKMSPRLEAGKSQGFPLGPGPFPLWVLETLLENQPPFPLS